MATKNAADPTRENVDAFLERNADPDATNSWKAVEELHRKCLENGYVVETAYVANKFDEFRRMRRGYPFPSPFLQGGEEPKVDDEVFSLLFRHSGDFEAVARGIHQIIDVNGRLRKQREELTAEVGDLRIKVEALSGREKARAAEREELSARISSLTLERDASHERIRSLEARAAEAEARCARLEAIERDLTASREKLMRELGDHVAQVEEMKRAAAAERASSTAQIHDLNQRVVVAEVEVERIKTVATSFLNEIKGKKT